METDGKPGPRGHWRGRRPRAHSEGRRRDGGGAPGPGDRGGAGRDGQRGEQYLGQRKAEKLVTQRKEGNDDGRARRGCRGCDGDGSSVPSLPRRCSSVHWTVTRVVGAANDGRVKKQAEMKEISRVNAQGGELVSLLERLESERGCCARSHSGPCSWATSTCPRGSGHARSICPRYALRACAALRCSAHALARPDSCCARGACRVRRHALPCASALFLFSGLAGGEGSELRAASYKLRGCTHSAITPIAEAPVCGRLRARLLEQHRTAPAATHLCSRAASLYVAPVAGPGL
ncbi:hypothetical protein SVAN01_05952 [Stagonosporopsis vannaccii]|nr:hypothetical protein SVAN01_05952 [Stagonosporopsis vannaccii]